MRNQAQIREALKLAQQYAKLGITFIPVPTATAKDHNRMVDESQRRLFEMTTKEDGRECADCCHKTGGGYCNVHDSYRDTLCEHYE